MTTANTFDLIVIGAGSGGIAASRRAASHGAKVLLIEGTRVGGTCVLRGCIPKKLMMYASEMSGVFSEASAFGWTEVSTQFDIARWTQAKDHELNRLEGVYRQMLSNSGVQTLLAHARITGKHTVEADGQTYRAERILIATGGAPSTDGIPGLEQAWTSDDVLQLNALPKSLLVIGAGYIAVEFASILARLGVHVSMGYRADLPLRGFDEDLRAQAAQALESLGVKLHAGMRAKALSKDSDGFSLRLEDGGVLRADAVLNATGRKPNTWGLGLESVDIRTDASGAIPVDADSRTTAPGIWAIGDVTNRINLTPVAIAEGRAFADTEFSGRHIQASHANVASAVFCSPDRHHRAHGNAGHGARADGRLCEPVPPHEEGLRRQPGADLHETHRRSNHRSRDRHSHARSRCAGNHPGTGHRRHRGSHQARLRQHHGNASHVGGRVCADARAGTSPRLSDRGTQWHPGADHCGAACAVSCSSPRY